MRYFAKFRLMQRGEAIFTGLGSVLTGLLCLHLNLFEAISRFMDTHEGWQLDELFVVIFFAGLASFVLLARRARQMGREITLRQQAEERAHELARHDPLTGLPNRRLLHEELAAAVRDVARSGNECAVFLIDLDHFKAVNDLHGHEAGDAVLAEVAARLRSVCGPEATVGRFGGDEFICILRYQAGSEAPARLAGQIVRRLEEPLAFRTAPLDLRATVGVARCPVDATSADELIRAADVAMYDGKRAGRGVYHFFHAEMDAHLRERAALEKELRGAIEKGEIRAYFQPVISLSEKRISGFEALARWHHPTRGVLAPDLFVPIAEDVGLIDLLSYEILRQGCIAARHWPRYTSLSVNISPIQLKDPWLSARLLGVLAEHSFPPARLIVEVTENAIIDDVDLAREVFTSLHNSGVRIALDDFGRGYSSLYHLRQLRFDHLKIDSSFVLSMESSESEKIVRAIAGLGKSLGMPVTAEGVETSQSAEFLRDIGCEQAQGYLFGRPVDADETRKLFDNSDEEPAVKVRSA